MEIYSNAEIYNSKKKEIHILKILIILIIVIIRF